MSLKPSQTSALKSGLIKAPKSPKWQTAKTGPHKGLEYEQITENGQTFHRYRSGRKIRIPKTFDSIG